MNFSALQDLTVWFKNVNTVLTDSKINILTSLNLGFLELMT